VAGFLIVLAALAVLWVVVVLPVRRRQRAQTEAHEAMQDSLVLGDEIITAGGLHAIVRGIDDERLHIEIAPNVIATLDRRAVAAVAIDEGDDATDTGAEPARESEADAKPR
jgi:preprotein translocase subunit YajC